MIDLSVLVHDGSHHLSGTLGGWVPDGCELLLHNTHATPQFGANAKLILNFTRGPKTLSVTAKLVRAFQRKGIWRYRFKWASETSTLTHVFCKGLPLDTAA